MKYKLFTDGGSRGNPGISAIGGEILDNEDNRLQTFSEFIGVATNNVAEYTALIKGLNICLDNKYLDLNVFADSELMVKQINGLYKVKDENIKKLYTIAKNLISNFSSFKITHVLRDKNKTADTLVNMVLDAV